MTLSDGALLERALGILHRFGTEQIGWRAFFRRWYFSDEPLRNDAANLVREAGFDQPMPNGTRLVGDDYSRGGLITGRHNDPWCR